ncbi:MAG: hypothetical protein MJ236_03370 [Clostridia bacterium]|nr:hypothetical protein [Clostridia bacterium]
MRLSGIELVKALSDAFGPSSREKNVANLIIEQIGQDANVTIDRVGNVVAEIPSNNGSSTKTMICAHMDEPGFYVKDVDGDGKVWMKFFGDVPSQRISGRIGIINGKTKCLFAARPIHSLSGDERSKPTPIDRIYAEIGAKAKEDANVFVNVGDYGTFAPSFGEVGNFIKGKALGSRSACASLIEVIRNIKANNIAHDNLYFVFTVLGEIGDMGAEVATNVIAPEKSIVVDGLGAVDTPDVPQESQICKLGGGAVVMYGDAKTLFDRDMISKATTVADDNGYKYQLVMRQSKLGAGAVVQRSSGSRVCFGISIPVRYIKSASEMISIEDMNSVTSIVTGLI